MLSPATLMMLSTIRIEAIGNSAEASLGTGFLYQFPGLNIDEAIPCIVTNKHVIHGKHTVNLQLQIAPIGSELQGDGTAAGEVRWSVALSLAEIVVLHPDPHVDLAAIIFAPVLRALPIGTEIKNACLNSSWRLSSSEATFIRPVEPILMVGYPNGLWDEVNNRPITRQGLTASHPLHSWNGSRTFVIDAACFGGSSGSPVFLYEDGLYRDSNNSYSPGTRARLLGVLFAGPMVTAEGKLVQKPIPTSAVAVPQINLMMNLGYVVNISAIDEIASAIHLLLSQGHKVAGRP